MKTYLNLVCFTVVGLLFSLAALAADGVQPDFTATLLMLLAAIKDKASIAVILVAVFQLLRTAPVIGILGKFSGRWIQVIIATTTALGFVAEAWVAKGNIGVALVEGLFTAGGAMLVYTAIRSIKK